MASVAGWVRNRVGAPAAAALILLGAVLAGCSDSDGAAGKARADTGGAVPPDSAAAQADSAAAPAQPERKGGFLGGIFGGKQDEKTDEETPVPVELAAVTTIDLPAYLSTTATLQPEKQAEVLAKAAGEVRRILVEEGDWVEEGRVLAELDGEAQLVALQEIEARLGALALDLERAQALAEQKLASEKDLSDAQYRHDEAVAQRRAGQLQVEYTRIRAPFTGQIAARLVDPGQTVASGAHLFTVVDRDPLLAEIHVPEREAAKIRAGQEVVISPDTDLAESSAGQVLRVAPVVDPRTGTVKVTCQVDGTSAALRPGSFVRVQVQTDLRPDVPAVPKRALVPEGGELFVFKAEADSVIKTSITTGLSGPVLIEITSGLVAGERVVTVGHGALKTGTKVREVGAGPTVADSAPDAGR